jgi:hypothetical protein
MSGVPSRFGGVYIVLLVLNFFPFAAAELGDGDVISLPSSYHTTSQVSSMLRMLETNCNGMSVETVKEEGGSMDDVGLDVVRIRQHAPNNSRASHRIAMVFGEHAREMITVESALHLLQGVCGASTASLGSFLEADELGATAEQQRLFNANVTALLQDHAAELLIVPNANPTSRRLVEQGQFCLRQVERNGAAVDINRDWDTHWTASSKHGDDTTPGRAPFSQPETRILRKVLADFQPTFFVSVHSGQLGMFVPWAYSGEAPLTDQSSYSFAEGIDREFCQCPLGPAGALLGYGAPGTSLDYAYDKLKVPHSFAIEIWSNPASQYQFHDRWSEEAAGHIVGDAGKPLLAPADSSSFLAGLSTGRRLRRASRARRRQGKEAENQCLENFNPVQPDSYNDVVRRWRHALLALSLKVASGP